MFQAANFFAQVCNILLIAEAVLGSLQQTKPANLKEMEGDKKITRLAFAWVSASILPKKEFSGVWEEFQLADGEFAIPPPGSTIDEQLYLN